MLEVYAEVLRDMDNPPEVPAWPDSELIIRDAIVLIFVAAAVIGNIILWPVALGWVN